MKTMSKNRKNIIVIFACFLMIILFLVLQSGCISNLKNITTTTKTTTNYDANGKIIVTVEDKTVTTKEKSGWPVAGKAFSMEQDAAFFALEVMASAETGGYPMPNIKYFRGNSSIHTVPMVDWRDMLGDSLDATSETSKNANDELKIKLLGLTNYSETLTIESSYWDDSIAFLKHRREGSGANIPATQIQYKLSLQMGSDTPRANLFQSIFGGR